MSKQTNTRSSKEQRLSKSQIAKLEELKARDEFERQWALSDLTNPDKVGLSTAHANLVCDKLREAYIKNEILAQSEEDLEDDFTEDDNEEESIAEDEEEETDDVEFSEPDDETEFEDEDETEFEDEDDFEEDDEDTFEEKKTTIKESPAESLGFGELEDELGGYETKEVGFPSEEEEEDEDEEEIVYPTKNNSPVGKGRGLMDGTGPRSQNGTCVLYDDNDDAFDEDTEIDTIDETFPLGMGIDKSEDVDVSLEPGMDKVVIELPGGQKLNLELVDDLANPKEEIEMGENNKEARKASRREIVASIIKKAAEEDIKPKNRNLGNDTSSQGKPFVKEEASRGVANPGLKGEKMTLDNSAGNSLLSNPNFTPNTVPTVNPEMIANNPDAFDIDKFTSGNSGLFTQKMEGTLNEIPTMGDTDDLWGSKNMINGFELPSQLDSTQDRRTNVLASKTVECQRCHNEDDLPISIVKCDDCGSSFTICSGCIEDETLECPVCASQSEENIKVAAGPNWSAYCKTPQDRSEICEDNRGNGDTNNDGAFRVKRTEDDDEGDGNYDLEVNASKKTQELTRENQELKLALAKFAKAVETATVMAYGETIDVTEIPSQVSKFMEDSHTSAAGLEYIKQTAASIAKKNSQTKLSSVENKMNKNAGANKIMPSSFNLGFNPNPSQERAYNTISDMKEALKSVFTYPKRDEDE